MNIFVLMQMSIYTHIDDYIYTDICTEHTYMYIGISVYIYLHTYVYNCVYIFIYV